MSAFLSPARMVLGRGRDWDGIPVPASIAPLFRSDWDEAMELPFTPATRLFDLYWDPDEKVFIVLTDVAGGGELRERDVDQVWAWLYGARVRPKSVERAKRLTRVFVPAPIPSHPEEPTYADQLRKSRHVRADRERKTDRRRRRVFKHAQRAVVEHV